MDGTSVELLARIWHEYEALWWWLALASVVMLLLSALAIPWLIVRLPEDFYLRPAATRAGHPGARIGHLAKNAAGALLLVAGIAMLVLPGQGILTILAALALLDFPGKRDVERRILAYPAILGVANHLRARAGRAPLRLAHQDPPGDTNE